MAPEAAKAAIPAWRCGAPSKMYGPASGAAATMGDVFGLTCLRYRCNSRRGQRLQIRRIFARDDRPRR